MKLKEMVRNNYKRVLGTALLSSLLVAQTVGASTNVSDSIKSKGNIEYDANGDGNADVYFYSKDLTTIGTGIDNLNTNMATLGDAFDDLRDTTTQYKTNIIAGLNSNVYAKNNIASDATFEQIIDKIRNIPAPTVATASYYGGGNNAGLGVTNSSNQQASVSIDGVTELGLAVNEAITLPSGYYPNDITVKNNVVNRGSISSNPSSRTSNSYSAGYYSSVSLSTSNAYDAGYRDGVNSVDVPTASGTYYFSRGKGERTSLSQYYAYADASAVYSQGWEDGYAKGKENAPKPEPQPEPTPSHSTQAFVLKSGVKNGFTATKDCKITLTGSYSGTYTFDSHANEGQVVAWKKRSASGTDTTLASHKIKYADHSDSLMVSFKMKEQSFTLSAGETVYVSATAGSGTWNGFSVCTTTLIVEE